MIRRISTTISTLILIAAIAALSFLTEARGVLVRAADASVSYAKSAVMDDLKGATIDGKIFDLDDYPAKADAAPELLLFTEYCFSKDPAKAKDFGLFAYVYNPGGITFDNSVAANTYFNKIQLAVNEQGYRKYSMIYLNRSTAADGCDGRFYKFQISLGENTRDELLEELAKNEERVYKLSGFELRDPAAFNATEYAIAQTYTFTGYVKGYGAGSQNESTLSCTLDALDTVAFDVNHTFYRTKTSELGGNYKKQINTVYFAVPKQLFEAYGKLQRIKAEWYEYKTKPIVVTSDRDFYNAALPYVGKLITEGGNTNYDTNIGYGIGSEALYDDFNTALSQFLGYNWNILPDSHFLGSGDKQIKKLVYLLPTKNWCGIDEYDPLTDYSDSLEGQGNALLNYIYAYQPKPEGQEGGGDSGFGGGGGGSWDVGGEMPSFDGEISFPTVNVKGGTLPAELFEDDIDDSRKITNESGNIDFGYSYYDFNANTDLHTLNTWSDTKPSFWDTWNAFGFWDAILDRVPQEASKTAAPIYVLTDTDMSASNADLIDNLLINAKDVDAIRAAYNEAEQNDEYLVLFRFAVSDYYSAAAEILQYGLLHTDEITGRAYIAQESVFLDFDVIQLTFEKESVKTIVPAVSSPIDIVNDPTPPTDMPPDTNGAEKIIKIILAVILTVVVAVLIGVIIYKVIKNRREKS